MWFFFTTTSTEMFILTRVILQQRFEAGQYPTGLRWACAHRRLRDVQTADIFGEDCRYILRHSRLHGT